MLTEESEEIPSCGATQTDDQLSPNFSVKSVHVTTRKRTAEITAFVATRITMTDMNVRVQMVSREILS